MKESTAVSPRIASVTWGRMKVEGLGWGKDFKLYPGGGREWDWAETGTQHVPGIQPSDVQELLDHGARVVVLSRGMLRRLQVCPQTLKLLKGNRFNGLITPYRPMTMESAAGKNPVTHVGKLYNVAANRIATAIVAEIKVVSEVGCYLASQIGRPVDQPQAVEVRTLAGEETLSAEIKNRIEEIVHDQLSRLNRIWEESVQCQSSLDRICLSEVVLLCFRSLSDAD